MRHPFHLLPFAAAITVLASHRVDAQELKISGTPVNVILEQLGAKLELGATAEQMANYSRLFTLIDEDGDGQHSKSEYIDNGNYLTPQARRGIFNAADADKDGIVTRAEYTLNRIITDESKTIVQAMDDDKDGVVQRSEFIAHASSKFSDATLAAKVFASLDTDGDGQIVVPEYLRIWGAWARIHKKTAEERIATASKKNDETPADSNASNASNESNELTTEDKVRLAELDAYWAEVSRCVRGGDFEGYKATCHEEGVLVSGSTRSSYPLPEALSRWQNGFDDTRTGKISASVEFRFNQRLGDETTAHETGMFCYTVTDSNSPANSQYIHFEALLVKRETWKIMMEYQKSKGTREEWDSLK